MTDIQFILLVLVLAAATALTRFLPFLIFGRKGKTPTFVDYLGRVLPAAMMGLLVVYCFKDVDFGSLKSIIPIAVSSLVVAGIHLWKRNTILSISLGTIVYMILLRI